MPTGYGIKGNTLRVYLHLLKNGPCELRDVQRGLGLSTASLASYHLGRLVDAGYAKQNGQGMYAVTDKSPEEILQGYSKIGSIVVPQLLFFALLFTILVAFFAYEVVYGYGFTMYLVALSFAMIVVLWYETARLWVHLGEN